MENYLRIDLVEIIEYASIQKTINRGCTLTKWTQVNYGSDHPRVHTERVACW